MRYVDKYNATRKYTNLASPILKRSIQDHAIGEITRCILLCCMDRTYLDVNLKNLLVEKKGPVNFKIFRRVLVLALAQNPSESLGNDVDEHVVWDHYNNRDGTKSDLAQALYEELASKAKDDRKVWEQTSVSSSSKQSR